MPVDSTTSRQQRQQPLHDQRRQAEAHLVDDEQAGLRRESPRHGEHLLLAAGEETGLALRERGELGEELEHLPHRSPTSAAPDAEVLEHGQVEEQRPVLGHEGDAAGVPLRSDGDPREARRTRAPFPRARGGIHSR